MSKTNFIATLALTVATALAPLSAPAQEVDDAAVFDRLHLVSALRNNTQHMARVACLVYIGFEPEREVAELVRASAEFGEISEALLMGDAEMGLAPENNQRVVSAIDALRDAWPMLEQRLDRVIRGESVDAGLIAEIDLYSINLRDKANDMSRRIVNVYSEIMSDVPLILILTVDIAEQQIMRTEKAAKDACLIKAGVNVEGNRADLEKTVTVFSATLDALINGFPGMILAAPNAEIREVLDQAAAAWEAPKALLTTLYQGGEITPEEQTLMEHGLEYVAEKMTLATELYVALESE